MIAFIYIMIKDIGKAILFLLQLIFWLIKLPFVLIKKLYRKLLNRYNYQD